MLQHHIWIYTEDVESIIHTIKEVQQVTFLFSVKLAIFHITFLLSGKSHLILRGVSEHTKKNVWLHVLVVSWAFLSFFSPSYSDAVDSVTSLYNHVEEQAHVLVQRTNMSLEHLEYLMQLREMEGHFKQVHYIYLYSIKLFRWDISHF